jgi:hypothetical protein
MKDIQKIKEFFSKPLEESLTRGYPYQETSGKNIEKITITEPIDDDTKNKMIQNFRDKGWDAKPNNGGGITAIKKTMMEAKEEDKVDTITMDVPLFLRMLEYSREDAAQDVDLHDITEKAISLNKEKDILSMEDYDAIVGSAEEIEEGFYGKGDKRRGLQNQSKLSSAEYQMAKKLKSFKASDWKWNADEDLYTKVVKEATDYMKRRKSEDDYATKKPKQPAYTGKTDYQKGREAEKKLAETIFSKLKEAKSTPCWKGYEQKGMKKKDGRQVPNCVPKN